MKRDTLYTGAEARGGLIAGIRKCRDAVGGTMGSGGANSIIEAMENPGHRLTNDGATILESIRLADPLEEMGRRVLLEAVSRSNKASGDGSSTATVLTAAILEEGMKYVGEHSPMDIKTSLEACIPLIEESINTQKRLISVDEVGAVAAISAESEEIGAKIQEIYKEIGKDGIIHWDVSKTGEDYYTIGQGITVEGARVASPYMFDFADSGQIHPFATLKDPQVLITKEKITAPDVFNDLFTKLNSDGKKEVVIFCEDYDAPVLSSFVQTRIQRGFRTVLVKLPAYFRDEWFEDLAKASGATIIDPIAGLSLRKCTKEHLGTFSHVRVTAEDTFIDGIKDLTDHIADLNKMDTDASKLRASRLNTKTARYFVGGISDSAISHRRYKVEDAIAAAYHGLNGGVVAGGGVALYNAAVSLDFTQSIGKRILHESLQAPMRQIVKNAGIDLTGKMRKVFSNEGFDTRTGKQIDMFEAHITDPAQIVLNAVKNSISVAASILTINSLVLLPRELQEEMPQI